MNTTNEAIPAMRMPRGKRASRMKSHEEIDRNLRQLLEAANFDGFVEYFESLSADERAYAFGYTEIGLLPEIKAPFRAAMAKIRNRER
jgi:hypothetical protein